MSSFLKSNILYRSFSCLIRVSPTPLTASVSYLIREDRLLLFFMTCDLISIVHLLNHFQQMAKQVIQLKVGQDHFLDTSTFKRILLLFDSFKKCSLPLNRIMINKRISYGIVRLNSSFDLVLLFPVLHRFGSLSRFKSYSARISTITIVYFFVNDMEILFQVIHW